jgi:bifunctional non-homologous end joining protein LigD
MLLLPTPDLPEGSNWTYELKFDGYRALAFKAEGKVHLRSRNNKDFSTKYARVAEALAGLPDETVVDGEIVALDESGKPSFNALQNYSSASAPIFLYVFDVLVLLGRDVMSEPLKNRRNLLRTEVLASLKDPVRECPELNASLAAVIEAVRAQGLEGVVAKNLNSRYEPGKRSGAWRKMRLNKGQEFVIGGYTVGASTFDAIIFGYYEDKHLLYAGRTRNGFTAALRTKLQKRFEDLEVAECPFANLPEENSGRWGLGLTAEKMKTCRWVRPELVGQIEFVEWTPDGHLRHSRFVALREDVSVESVKRET